MTAPPRASPRRPASAAPLAAPPAAPPAPAQPLLAAALAELADAHAELARQKAFTDALLETIEVGIVSCDADGVFVVSNRAERAMFDLQVGLEGLRPHDLHPLIHVFDTDGHQLTPESYPLMRVLRGEDMGYVDVLVGPAGQPARREVVVRAHRILDADGQVLGAVAALTDVTAERSVLRTLLEERRKLAEAQHLGQLGGFDYDPATSTWDFSDQLSALWGVPPGSLTPHLLRSLIVEEDREPVSQGFLLACRVAGQHSVEMRICRAGDGAARVLRARFEVSLDEAGEPRRVRGTHLDITDLEMAQRSARRATAFSDAVLAASPDTTVVTDLATGAIRYASPGKDVLGRPVADLVALGPDALVGLTHPEDLAALAAFTAGIAHLADGSTRQLRHRALDVTGRWRWLNQSATPFRRDDAGRVVEVLAVLRDITSVVDAEQVLTHAASHDSLTGLPNRALLMESLEAALERSRVHAQEVAVLFIDLDRFKEVNDTGGHSAGDAVLRETARRLVEVLRAEDTVARVGGDEFVAVVEPVRGPATGPGHRTPAQDLDATRSFAVDVAARITEALRHPITVRGTTHVVTASIGITFASLPVDGPAAGMTVDGVLHRADAAMYWAKERGRDRFEVLEVGGG